MIVTYRRCEICRGLINDGDKFYEVTSHSSSDMYHFHTTCINRDQVNFLLAMLFVIDKKKMREGNPVTIPFNYER